MAQRRFGSRDSTGRKLDVINEYLKMYQKALSNTSLKTVYIDGFAGSGEIPISSSEEKLFDDAEVQDVIVGSADRALNVDPPFDSLTFIDKRRSCVDALKRRFEAHSYIGRVNFVVGDANERVREICNSENWRWQRGVVLLDPFGNQVGWDTIERIAATEALDLWYLFPAGLGVFRQISNAGTVDRTHEASITRLFGTEDWKSAFLKPSPQMEMFDDRSSFEKVVTPESAAAFMIERLRSVFKGGVLDEMIPLGKHSYPSFYLLFAWANPSERAKALARRLSRAAVRATDRMYGRS